MPTKHRVFLSFHHAGDQLYKDRFVREFGHVFVDHSVRNGDIRSDVLTDTIARRIRDEFIRDATVTVVLVGNQTWQRKHVDWEIRSSLRGTRANARTGLIGVLLPSYRKLFSEVARATSDGRAFYTPHNLPPVLAQNTGSYAKVLAWPTSSSELSDWIHQAFNRRNQQPDPSLAGDRFARNRSGDRWW